MEYKINCSFIFQQLCSNILPQVNFIINPTILMLNHVHILLFSLCILPSCLGPPLVATKISQEVCILHCFFIYLFFFLRFFRMFSFRRRMAIRIVVLAATADRNVKGNVTQLEAASHKHLY